jgi:hypothetical protein
VNDEEEVRQVTADDYPKRAITDFMSLISLFKDSNTIDVKEFVNDIGLGKQTPETPTPAPGEEAGAGLEAAAQEESKLTSFLLSTQERISQVGQTSVSIAGEENVNNMLSFKVSVDEESTPFNTPEPAIAHFNRVFFDNIVKTIDKELDAQNE